MLRTSVPHHKVSSVSVMNSARLWDSHLERVTVKQEHKIHSIGQSGRVLEAAKRLDGIENIHMVDRDDVCLFNIYAKDAKSAKKAKMLLEIVTHSMSIPSDMIDEIRGQLDMIIKKSCVVDAHFGGDIVEYSRKGVASSDQLTFLGTEAANNRAEILVRRQMEYGQQKQKNCNYTDNSRAIPLSNFRQRGYNHYGRPPPLREFNGSRRISTAKALLEQNTRGKLEFASKPFVASDTVRREFKCSVSCGGKFNDKKYSSPNLLSYQGSTTCGPRFERAALQKRNSLESIPPFGPAKRAENEPGIVLNVGKTKIQDNCCIIWCKNLGKVCCKMNCVQGDISAGKWVIVTAHTSVASYRDQHPWFGVQAVLTTPQLQFCCRGGWDKFEIKDCFGVVTNVFDDFAILWCEQIGRVLISQNTINHGKSHIVQLFKTIKFSAQENMEVEKFPDIGWQANEIKLVSVDDDDDDEPEFDSIEYCLAATPDVHDNKHDLFTVGHGFYLDSDYGSIFVAFTDFDHQVKSVEEELKSNKHFEVLYITSQKQCKYPLRALHVKHYSDQQTLKQTFDNELRRINEMSENNPLTVIRSENEENDKKFVGFQTCQSLTMISIFGQKEENETSFPMMPDLDRTILDFDENPETETSLSYIDSEHDNHLTSSSSYESMSDTEDGTFWNQLENDVNTLSQEHDQHPKLGSVYKEKFIPQIRLTPRNQLSSEGDTVDDCDYYVKDSSFDQPSESVNDQFWDRFLPMVNGEISRYTKEIGLQTETTIEHEFLTAIVLDFNLLLMLQLNKIDCVGLLSLVGHSIQEQQNIPDLNGCVCDTNEESRETITQTAFTPERKFIKEILSNKQVFGELLDSNENLLLSLVRRF